MRRQMDEIGKAIPSARARAQSDLLAGSVGALLAMKALATVWVLHRIGPYLFSPGI